MPPYAGIRVVRSSIDGYGVIATRSFAPGEFIAEVDGVVWQEEEDVDDRYSLRVGDGYYFDMVDQTRWINHSCDPNSDVEVGREKDGRVLARVVALRAIRAGEEITYDYAFPAALAEPCRCGARTCRGMIVDEEEVHLLPVARPATG